MLKMKIRDIKFLVTAKPANVRSLSTKSLSRPLASLTFNIGKKYKLAR